MDEEEYLERLQEMKRETENALARASIADPPVRQHRLSEGGGDAAAVRTALKSPDMPAVAQAKPLVKEDIEWTPSSWTTKPIKQDVMYASRAPVERALAKLEHLPPIVTPKEVCDLRNQLAAVARGEVFLLQGGDCAELFSYCEQNAIDSKIKLLLQMSLILIWGSHKPVVRIARMAGQYAKPRSSPIETLADGRQVPSFRGDILNGFDIDNREPDPNRLVEAYFHSAATMNYIRAQLSSGLADLHQPLNWELGHVRDEELKDRYSRIVNSIQESMSFMHTIGADRSSAFESVDLFTSHEALVLEYEQSLTRKLPHPPNRKSVEDTPKGDGKGWYNTSAHFVWIGDRTRQLDGAHVEYFRGLENPIGVKVGPSMATQELVSLLDTLNPRKEVGKVTLITRYGENKIGDMLGHHIEAVKKSGHVVVWQCDPMHG